MYAIIFSALLLRLKKTPTTPIAYLGHWKGIAIASIVFDIIRAYQKPNCQSNRYVANAYFATCITSIYLRNSVEKLSYVKVRIPKKPFCYLLSNHVGCKTIYLTLKTILFRGYPAQVVVFKNT